MGTKQPNILLIITDQLAAPALPVYGHPAVKTPHISALAEGGVVFESAYCNSPLCAPSRASMMTGQLPSRIGAYDNAAAFPADVPTFAHYLREAGYQTVLSGKMHFIGPDQLHGFEERLTTDIYPADFGWTPDWEHPDHRPGWYHNMLSVVQAGECVTSNQLDYDEEVAFLANRKLREIVRDEEDERPFLLTVSFTHPHDPFAITPEYWNRYDPTDIDLPTIPPIPYDELDPHSQRLHDVCGLGAYEQTEERVRNARRAYYGEISYIDDKIGELMATLDATGLSENTIVIFTSDHGEMLGERGLWYKMSFFEWSARVPLIFHAPTHFRPRRLAGHVSLVDLLPTLVELAADDVVIADQQDGRSLAPLLRGDDDILAEPIILGELLSEGAIAPLLMIRQGQYKYIYSEPDPEQLYDLENDPHELHNLVAQPDHAALIQDFRAELAQHWDVVALRDQVIASQRRRRLASQALLQGRHTPWDYQPFVDASQQYMRGHLDLNVLERRSRFPTPAVPPPDQTATLSSMS